MILETERLILRPWEESDAESLYEYAKDPAVGPSAGWPVHTDVENSREIIRTVFSAPETYAVCLKGDNRAIGSIGLISPQQTQTQIAEDEVEVGYWIGVPFWGNGYIPEAVKRLQQHAFEDLGCSAMWCGYYDGNEKSERCQAKCGFLYHHTEENKTCTLLGGVRTERYTRLTKIQWENLQARTLQIRKSQKQDLPRLMEIYCIARRFMAEQGNPRQWSARNWPPQELIERDIESGNSYVCTENGNVIGVFFFEAGKNVEPSYEIIEDGNWIGDEEYGVIHRIAGDGSRKGIGTFCINWAFEQCGHLRIDTHEDNRVMQNLLRKLGFRECGVIHVAEDKDPRIAYEKIKAVKGRLKSPEADSRSHI